MGDAGAEGGTFDEDHFAALNRLEAFIFVKALFARLRQSGWFHKPRAAMRKQPTRSDEYWQGPERHVTSRVDAAMLGTEEAREWLIPNLRGLERMARREGGERQTIQIIMSGRRLLGDKSAVSLTDDPFARVPSAVP